MRNKNKKPLVIAAIGDSVTAGFSIASDPNMFWRMWLGEKISRLSEIVRRVSSQTPIIFHNYSSAGAKLVDKAFSKVMDRLYNIKSMAMQVDELLRLPRFPDMILIWMGHNELNVAKSEKDFGTIVAGLRNQLQ